MAGPARTNTALDLEATKAAREENEDAPEVHDAWPALADEQAEAAIGMAASLVARTGTLDETFDVLLRGRTDPGRRGFRISIGEVETAPPEPAPPPAA